MATRDFTSSRTQLHYAIQGIASVNNAYIPPQEDGSHTTLDWDSKSRLFVGGLVSGDGGQPSFQVALNPQTLESQFLDANGEVLDISGTPAKWGLVNKSLADLFAWQPEERFDSIFFAFWLSHVPEEQFDRFWGTLRETLALSTPGIPVTRAWNVL